jgi:hypothetical protein
MGYRTERIFVLATILLIGLGLTLAVSRGSVAGAPGSNALLLWTLTIMLVVVAAGGSVWLRSARQLAASASHSPSAPGTSGALLGGPGPMRQRARVQIPLETVVPALLVGGFTLFIQLFDSGILQTLILILAALSFAAVYWAQVHALDISDRFFSLSQAILNIISHLCAFLLFATIYGLKTRSLISASAVTLATFLLVFEMLSRDVDWHRALELPVEGRRWTVILLSLVCGLVLGELTWGLNYWAALTTLVGGAFLLVAFYVTYGLASHYLDHKLDRQTVLEFALVGIVGVAAVFLSAFLV